MIKIYHNPRCKKSRAGLEYLQSKVKDFEIVKYLNDTPSIKELKEIIAKTGKKPGDFIRKQEEHFKRNMKGKELSDDQILEEMVSNPKIIERPIIVHDDKAVLGNPPEEIDKIL
ncbi:arsenate reductase (glutaredoxin) [Salinivirga cyanobacteriivorans]